MGKIFAIIILKDSRAAEGVKHSKEESEIEELKKTALVRSKGEFSIYPSMLWCNFVRLVTKMAVVFPVMSDF